MVNYNGSDVLRLTLASLLRARVRTPFVVCLVENGSSPADAESAKTAFLEYTQAQKGSSRDIFLPQEKNLGFCGGSNLAIRELLALEDVERVCLLNTDVIVTDGWLDRLMESDAEIVGPVTNANGNEQTVWIDYEAERSGEAFGKVNEFAHFRGELFRGYEVASECVTGFCALIKRSVIQQVGDLDERYFPGGFDDNDYAQRVRAAGGRIAIRRDCYIHHWGGGSFSKMQASDRVNVSLTNLVRYETKWGEKWKGTQRLLPESLMQDIAFLRDAKSQDERAWTLMSDTARAIEAILENYETAKVREEIARHSEEIDRQLKPTRQLEVLPYVPNPGWKQVLRSGKETLQKAYHAVRAPGRRKGALKEVLDFIQGGKDEKRGTIAILAPFWREEKMRDGYFQRIYAVDQQVLKDYRKLYFESDPKHPLSVEKIDADHMVIHFPYQKEEDCDSVFLLLKACGVVYAHSLLRFVHSEISPRMLKWLTGGHVKLIVDAHGAVPEEAAFSDNWVGTQIYQTLEEVLMAHADAVVCVNHAMVEHFRTKYDYAERLPAFLIMPIFPELEVDEELIRSKLQLSDYGKPLVVYAGGLQRWQNVTLMQDIISKTVDRYRFDIMVSDPVTFSKLYGDRPGLTEVQVRSVPPREVGLAYKKAHFGFVLRDDVTVNRVACPTKLVEYISYGVLPVMKTTRLGDFVSFGMEYLAAEDLLAGKIPSPEEFSRMIQKNTEVLSQLRKEFESGRQQLCAFIERGRVA